MEFLSYADPARAARVVESLSGAEVHVVLTVRDAARAIPAQWQSLCRNASTIPLPRFVRAVRETLNGATEGSAVRAFQRTQGIPRMLGVWQPLVGSRGLHVVTMPPPGSAPTMLWERFATAVGVDPSVCTRDPGPSNPTMGHASIELLRQVNREMARHPSRECAPFIGVGVTRTLVRRASLEEPVRLDRRGMVLAGRWNAAVRTAIGDSGARVVGDLGDLPIHQADPSMPPALPKPSPEALLDAAAAGRDGILDVQAWLEQGASLRGVRRGNLDPPRPGAEPTSPERWSHASEPVQAAAHELVEIAGACLTLHRSAISAGDD
jgi:hypothetical protein